MFWNYQRTMHNTPAKVVEILFDMSQSVINAIVIEVNKNVKTCNIKTSEDKNKKITSIDNDYGQ